ncbi:FtsK/SpoIIIE domain-containing protein [Clostridium perfringens]
MYCFFIFIKGGRVKFYKSRGIKIRSSDKSLVINFLFRLMMIAFGGVIILLHGKQILNIDFKYITVLKLDNFSELITLDFIFSIIIALGVSISIVFMYCYFNQDRIKQLTHRQKLARMILENKWYESESIKGDEFFKDLNVNNQKEKIVYFPKMYYKLNEGLIYIQVEITLGKYQEQLLNLEKKLESGLYCELVSKELKDSYIEYVLLYDTIANRISINDVKVKDGSLKLMKSVYWEFDKLPHMLIAGGTGGGKTYFILTIIEALLNTNSVLYVLDPKNADLADLKAVMPNVYYKKDDMISCINNFYDEMMKRSEAMKIMDNYKTGENYAYLGLPAHFLIFDEYVAFMEMLGTKENTAVLNKLKQIVMLGRQAGFFLILACQRPDAKYLGDGIRDQFNFRVALGRMSELGYNMMFGESNKDFFLKQIKGRGYVDVGTNVISEFYTPLVPKEHDFLEEIGKIISRQVEKSSCEAKDEVSN